MTTSCCCDDRPATYSIYSSNAQVALSFLYLKDKTLRIGAFVISIMQKFQLKFREPRPPRRQLACKSAPRPEDSLRPMPVFKFQDLGNEFYEPVVQVSNELTTLPKPLPKHQILGPDILADKFPVEFGEFRDRLESFFEGHGLSEEQQLPVLSRWILKFEKIHPEHGFYAEWFLSFFRYIENMELWAKQQRKCTWEDFRDTLKYSDIINRINRDTYLGLLQEDEDEVDHNAALLESEVCYSLPLIL
jgi:hypothetical protein